MERRGFLSLTAAIAAVPAFSKAATRDIWTAPETAEALLRDEIVLLDVRSRGEWRETGVAQGAWPLSMHEKGFQERLFTARELSTGKTIALICATGGRSARLLFALKRAGYTEFVDVSEGMMGSKLGPGWIARGLPVVSLDAALAEMPEDLA